MADEVGIKGVVSLDTSDADKAFGKIEGDAKRMAQAVGKAGADAGKGLEGIGVATEKLTGAQSRFIEQVKRNAIVATEGRAAYTEQKAAILGVSDSVAPYIAKLKMAEQGQVSLASSSKQATVALTTGATGLNAYGQSAKQTAAALRGVPAQLTDIFTSLQGGQAPITVLLQQGGQLKDMFGGIVPAAKALGGAVLGLINPFTIAAGVAVGLGAAFFKGAEETTAFNKALILSGNAVGTTAGQLNAYAAAISQVVGTQGAAAEALAAFAQSGAVGAANLQNFAQGAIQFERATGQAISKTVDAFKELAKAPLETTIKLNEQYGYLTLSIYQQIKALEDQGRATDAANVAQKAYADFQASSSGQITANLGLIERGWLKIKDATKAALDAALSVGRTNGTNQQLAAVQAEIAKARQPFDPSNFGGNAAARANLQANLELEKSLNRQLILQVDNAAATASQTAQVKAQIEFDKQGSKFLDQKVKMEREIVEARNLGNAAGLTEVQIQARIADIRKSYEKKGSSSAAGQSELASLRARVIAEQQYLDALKLRGSEADKLNEGEKIALRLQEQLKGKLDAKVRATKELELAEAVRLAGVLKLTAAEQERIKLDERILKDQDKIIEGMFKAGDSIRERATAQENANATFDLGKAALEELTLAQYRNSLASLESTNNVIPGAIEAIRAQITEQERLIAALKKGEELTAGKKLSEEYANQAKKAYEEFDKANEKIADSFVDNLMRGGKSVAQYLKDLFRTLVLKPILQPVGNALSSALSGITGGGGIGQAAGMFGGASNLLGGASALGAFGSSASSVAMGVYGGIGELSSLGFMEALSGGVGAVLEGSIAAGFGTLAGVLGPIGIGVALLSSFLSKQGETRSGGQYENGQFLVGPSGGQIGSDGVSQAIGATMLSINATLQALGSSSSLAKLVSGLESSEKGRGFAYAGGALNNGAVFGQGIDGQGFMNRRGNLTPEEATKAFQTELEQATLQAIQAAADIPETIAKQLRGIDVDALGDEARKALLSSINGSIVAVEGFGKAVEFLPFERLKTLSFDAAAGLIAAGGGLENLTGSLNAYYENFYSEEEKRLNVAGNIKNVLGKAGIETSIEQILGGTREGFRAVLEAADDQTKIALLSVAEAFASIVPATVTAVDTVEELSAAVEVTLAGALEALRNPLRTIEDIAQSIFGLETEGKGLQVELLRAQGNGPGADALQRALDTAGFTEAEVAAYDFNKALREQIDQLNAAAEAARANADANAQAATAAAQAAAQQAAAVANERQGLQDQINALTDTEAQALERVRGALDETNRALFDQVQALTAQKTAAEAAAQAQAEAAEAAAQAAAAVTQERAGLQEQLNALTDTAAQALARQRAALDESNRSIFDQIQALTAQKAATEAAAQAATAAAQAAAAIAQQRSGLEKQILELQGDTNALRKLELASLDASLRPLQERIFAMRDEAAAASQLAATLQRISGERSGLETQILQLQGNTAELRKRELEALDPSNRALQKQIYALEDQKAAADAAAVAASQNAAASLQSASAAEQMKQAWQSVTDSIFDEVKRIRGLLGNGGQNFARAQADFAINTAKARAGDQDAAKLLPGLSQALLELGEQNATSSFDLRKLRAGTASSLEVTGGQLAKRFGLQTPQNNEAVVAELATLREELRAQSLAMARMQADQNRIFKGWDQNGLPETRVTA